MKKLASLLILGATLLAPSAATFATDQEGPFAGIPTTVEGEVEYFEVSAADPDIFLADGRCDGEDENITKSCKLRSYDTAVRYTLEAKNIELPTNVYVETLSKDDARFVFTEGGSMGLGKDVKLRYATVDADEVKEAMATVTSELMSPYVIYDGLGTLDALHNHTHISDDDILLEFPQFKAAYDKYSNDFDFVLEVEGLGATQISEGGICSIGIAKDDILYGELAAVSYSFYGVLLVPEGGEATIYEKAEQVINDYFKNNPTVSVAAGNGEATTSTELDGIVNHLLDQTSGTYEGYGALATFADNNREIDITIVEVPAEFFENPEDADVYSEDTTTGVIISTDSDDVPSDVILEVVDNLGGELVEKFEELYGTKIEASFDVTLKDATTGDPISNIPDGVDVYFPVLNKIVGDRYEVFHIKDDGTKGESKAGIVVRVGEKLYLKFTSFHFSTYAIGEKIIASTPTPPENTVKNPDTSDPLPLYITLAVGSLIGLTLCGAYLLKQTKKH